MYMVAEQKMLCPIHSMNRYICHTKYFCLYLENIVFISLANTCMSPDSSQWGSLWLLEEPGCSSFAPGESLGFVLSCRCSRPHCATQSAVVHSRVWHLHWRFLQVEGAVCLQKTGLKTSVLHLLIRWAFQEENRLFVLILDIPENNSWIGGLVGAIQGQKCPLWEGHRPFCLVHGLSTGPPYKM